eukprot:885552-Amphidinium_carterae.1
MPVVLGVVGKSERSLHMGCSTSRANMENSQKPYQDRPHPTRPHTQQLAGHWKNWASNLDPWTYFRTILVITVLEGRLSCRICSGFDVRVLSGKHAEKRPESGP